MNSLENINNYRHVNPNCAHSLVRKNVQYALCEYDSMVSSTDKTYVDYFLKNQVAKIGLFLVQYNANQ
jgi:hypothetical protein